jgi:siderophore synthetase component
MITDPQDAVAHLTPEAWTKANERLVRKALAELSHERLLTPKRVSTGTYVVRSDDDSVEYRFTAEVMALDHWRITPGSVRRHRVVDGERLPLDAGDLLVEFRGSLQLTDEIIPVYLEEITSTLASLAYKLSRPTPRSADLVEADFQTIEAAMVEGHPCFVANSGRIGFGVDDHHVYAPEAANPTRLIWVAAHRDHTTFTCSPDVDYDGLMRAELGEATLRRFAATMADLGLDLADYLLIPVHPWQWWSKLSVTFARELALRHLVCLGPGDDDYRPHQSIRTFFNVSAPHKHYVKTALSVLNMGFMRGLSAAYMEATPAINDWVAGLIANDDILRRTSVSILRERAAVGYRHRQFEAVTDRTSPYRKMLAALWRESPVPTLEPGRRLATMASLLHVDQGGQSFAAALVERSGLPPATWLRRYLDAYLVPLLHFVYAYGVAFMPHGENVILVLRDGVVERAILKDIGEEVVVMERSTPVPPGIERIRADIGEDEQLLAIFTDVFDCFLRFLNAILVAAGVLDESTFWRTVAECVSDYQASVPHLAERTRRLDIFAATFPLSCLNRLQLRNNRQMVDLADPSSSLQLAGELENPIAAFRPRS